MMEEEGFVYFIQAADGPIKIGFSVEPTIRFVALQSSHATKLTMLGAIHGTQVTEKTIHSELNNARIRGEWFRPTAEVLRYVASTMSYEQTEEALRQKAAVRLLDGDTDRVPRAVSDDSERETVIKVIAQADGNISVAARMLGWARRTLQNRMRKLQIEPGKAGRPPLKAKVRL